MKILATIHFLDGQAIEKEFASLDQHDYCATYVPGGLRIWLDHTKWVEMPGNTFLPSSQIAKVTWKELPE